MNTTSLEMSKKLDAAGFWKEREFYCSWYKSKITESTYTLIPALFDAKLSEHICPAATLDDLVTALGLDKPWGMSEPEWANQAKCISDGLGEHGLTHDVLAQVWLDTKGASHE